MLRHARDAREDQLRRLKDWENEISAIESMPIKVENAFDLEGPPRHMTYITAYLVSFKKIGMRTKLGPVLMS